MPDMLNAALDCALIAHRQALMERDQQRTDLTWPDHSDIYRETRQTIKGLCSGDLDPEQYLADQEEA